MNGTIGVLWLRLGTARPASCPAGVQATRHQAGAGESLQDREFLAGRGARPVPLGGAPLVRIEAAQDDLAQDAQDRVVIGFGPEYQSPGAFGQPGGEVQV